MCLPILGAVFYNKESGRMTIPNMGANIDHNDPESVAKVTNKDANIRKNEDLIKARRERKKAK